MLQKLNRGHKRINSNQTRVKKNDILFLVKKALTVKRTQHGSCYTIMRRDTHAIHVWESTKQKMGIITEIRLIEQPDQNVLSIRKVINFDDYAEISKACCEILSKIC